MLLGMFILSLIFTIYVSFFSTLPFRVPGAEMNASRNRLLLIAVIFLSVSTVVLLIALIVVATSDKEDKIPDVKPCTSFQLPNVDSGLDDSSPSVFHDLTFREIAGLKEYLYEKASLDLVTPSDIKRNANFVFLAELHIPNKSDVLNFLDNKGPQPNREAWVVIIRGKPPNQEINELVVGPLPEPTYHIPLPGVNKSVPYFYRPFTEADYGEVIDNITDELHANFGEILFNCYGANLRECDKECLSLKYTSSFSPASSGVMERNTWYWLGYDLEYYSLHFLDFSVLVTVRANGSFIRLVWFEGHAFSSVEEAKTAFQNKSVSCQPKSFPQNDKNLFSSMNKRGNPAKHSNKRPPVFVEPDGTRYTVTGKHIDYMKWSFDFRMSTAYGPVVYDIRFDNKRFIYELGLQEISVFYSGHSPQQRFSDYMDSGELIGPAAQGLIPGTDCPDHATYFDAMHVTESSESADIAKNAFCLFELNTGEPLRRHHSYFKSEGSFYEGMENVILVLRTILTVVNYDYVLDFKFYQNGMLETKAMSTGYVLATAFSEMERKYGYQIHSNINANYHMHLFNFKVDLDINGKTNTYEVVNIKSETTENEFSLTNKGNYSQGYLKSDVIETEKQAAYKYDFNNPKYHLFYNKNKKNAYGNPRAYR